MSFVVTPHNDPGLATEKAKQLSNYAWERHQQFMIQNQSVDEAVAEAIRTEEGPIILVDVADNIGGCSPGDGTALLKALLEQKAGGALVVVADPESVSQAMTAGIDAEVRLNVGGKTDQLHGDPVEVVGKVRLISNGRFCYKGSYMTGKRIEMGATVVLDCDSGATLVLTTFKTMPFDLEQICSLGIDPCEQKIIVVKAAIAWRAAYEFLAKKSSKWIHRAFVAQTCLNLTINKLEDLYSH